MNKLFQKSALGFLCTALLLPAARAGTADGEGAISAGIPAPKFSTSVDLQEGYNDNVFTTNSNKTASGFTQAIVNVNANLNDPRTVFTIGVGGGLTYYYNRPGDRTDKLANLTINLVHKVSDRLVLTLNSYTTYQVQPQFDLLVEQNRVNGQYYYTTESLSAAYQWTTRLSTVTGYSVTGIFYEDSVTKLANDYVQQTFSNQIVYLALPTTSLVAEYRFGLVNYLYEPQMNSTTNYMLLGFNHTFSPKSTMTFRAGGEIQDQTGGNTSTSPYIEITGNYQYQRYSNIQAYLNYGFQYSNLTIAQTNKALRLGMTVNHGITPRLTASLGFFYEHDNYSTTPTATGYSDDTFNVNTGLHFALTPKFSLSALYQYTRLLSNVSTQNYDQNLFSIGAGYSF